MNARRAGDRGWLLEADVPLDVAAAVRVSFGNRVEEVVPGHATVLVVGDISAGELLAVEAPPSSRATGRMVEIPVTYDGTDLAEVASLTGLGVDEVIAIHSGTTYTAAFLGFLPGFAYLVGLDERLLVPRRPQPRTSVAGGTVAIAGPYSGIYPRESPGGWRLLGTTDAALFDETRQQPNLIAAADSVRFVPL